MDAYSGSNAVLTHTLQRSLAAGWPCPAAGDAGAALSDLMRQTRHKSTQVALAYLRPADL